MIKQIAYLEANENIVKRTESLLVDQIESGEVIVRQIGVKTIEKEVAELVRDGSQAVIARGGTYQDLAKLDIGVPLVRLTISPSDILLALNAAAKKFEKVDLILHQSIVFNPADYQELISICVKRYSYESIEGLNRLIEGLKYEDDSVIIGSGAIKELTNQRNLNFIDIFIQDTTIINAYHRTVRLLGQIEGEVQRTNLLESILYHVNEGVIIVDAGGVIVHFNRKSEELLQSFSDNVKHTNIASLIPEYPFSEYCRLKPGEQKNYIVTVGKRNLALFTSVFMLDQNNRQFIITVQDVSKLQKMEQNIRYMLAKKGLVAEYRFEDILTRSDEFKSIIHQAQRIAEHEGTVLIYGDSGTGKELFAQSIHNGSKRRSGPFVAVNCAAISENLLESELFGYVGGAFTGARKEGKAGLFELAHQGTIFLDEINSMTSNLQAKLLRVVEQREVMRVGSDYIIPLDVRIIAASNRKLTTQVREGEFRQDLYFRINTFELNIPPLADRKGDIVYLFRHFLAELNGSRYSDVKLEPEFEESLLKHDWWGNVRELRSVARRYQAYQGDNQHWEILSQKQKEEPDLLTEDLRIDLKELNRTVEELVIQSLIEKNMTRTEIANTLGISRQALYKKLNK